MKRCCAAILCIFLAVSAMVPAGAIAVVGYGLNSVAGSGGEERYRAD